MPELLRYRRPLTRMDDGSQPYQFSAPEEFYWQMYYQVSNLLMQKLDE